MKVSLFGVSTKKTTYSVAVLANIEWKGASLENVLL